MQRDRSWPPSLDLYVRLPGGSRFKSSGKCSRRLIIASRSTPIGLQAQRLIRGGAQVAGRLCRARLAWGEGLLCPHSMTSTDPAVSLNRALKIGTCLMLWGAPNGLCIFTTNPRSNSWTQSRLYAAAHPLRVRANRKDVIAPERNGRRGG